MPADLNNPFGESCCDGGATNCHQSAQPCGCDPGQNWFCTQHTKPLRPLPTQFLPKSRLVVGNYYIGFCRNANVARWDGQQFWYWRKKFTALFTESIKHPDDDGFFDVFQAVAEVKPEEVKEIPIGNETTPAV